VMIFDHESEHQSGNNIARKWRSEKKQTGWCSDNETQGGDGKTER
jgi:hypothetical protein